MDRNRKKSIHDDIHLVVKGLHTFKKIIHESGREKRSYQN